MMALFFGNQTEEYRLALEESKAGECITFWWIGQDFAHCDLCGRPYWRHLREPGFGDQAGQIRTITDSMRRRNWQKWHPDIPRGPRDHSLGAHYVKVAPEDWEPLEVGVDW